MKPMPLQVAVETCFPHGGVTKSTLLAEIRRGRLGYEKIGKTYMVTETDIEQWRQSCRVTKSPPGSTCARAGEETPCSSSSTTDERSALVAAQTMSAALKKNSGNTSPRRTAQTPGT